jgi:hypothetical protein
MNQSLVDTIAALIKAKDYVGLFRALASIETGHHAHKYDIYRELAPTYPVVAEIVHDARVMPACVQFFEKSIRYGNPEVEFWTAILWLNTMYINHIGCDCGGEVNLFSEGQEDNYRHHEHPKFREWAYRHMPEERRAELIVPLEAIRKHKAKVVKSKK